jgi:hypothetical protein
MKWTTIGMKLNLPKKNAAQDLPFETNTELSTWRVVLQDALDVDDNELPRNGLANFGNLPKKDRCLLRLIIIPAARTAAAI